MKKYLTLLSMFLLTAFMGACCLTNIAQPAPLDPIAMMNDATAVLIGYDETGDTDRICSAVWISQVELLTAAHCAGLALVGDSEDEHPDLIGKEIAYINRRDLGGQGLDRPTITGTAMITAVDTVHDLALLSGHREGHSVARVERGDIWQGQPIYVMGHTFGLPYSMSGGVIGADRLMKRNGHTIRVLQVFSGANYGNSGGGIWSESGMLLGIVSFRISDSSLSFAIHRDAVLEFLAHEAVEAL